MVRAISSKLNPILNRRQFIVGASVAILPTSASAALRCNLPNGAGAQFCEVGIDNQVQEVSAWQQQPQWCWAACVSAIFAFHGFPVSQSRIVEATYGRVVNLPAMGPQIAAATSKAWTSDRGDDFESECEVLWDQQYYVGRPDAVLEAARELADDQPLIIGTGGHCMVLTAMTYMRDAFGNGQPTSIVVRDPFPGRRRNLTPREWLSTTFLAKVNVSEI